MDLLLWLALALLPLGALAAVAAAVVGVVVRRSPPVVVAAALVPILLVAWVALTYQEGVRADETGTGGDVFRTAGWLAAAVVAGVGAAALALRGRRSSETARAGSAR